MGLSETLETEPGVSVMSHYELLGISPKASRAEIARAWKRQIVAHHPDRAEPSERDRATARAAAINAAYQVLREPAARRRYDRYHLGPRRRRVRTAWSLAGCTIGLAVRRAVAAYRASSRAMEVSDLL